MTLRYAMDNKPEQMKYFLLNMLQFQRTTGFLSCCANSANGASYTSGFHAQPFLAQNAAEIRYEKTGCFVYGYFSYEDEILYDIYLPESCFPQIHKQNHLSNIKQKFTMQRPFPVW